MLYGAMNFPVKPVLGELHAIADLGFDYLELTMDPPGAHHSVITAAQTELAGALSQRGLNLVCHLPTFVTTADLSPRLRAASVREVLDSLDAIAPLNPMKACLHPSYLMGLASMVPDLARGYAAEALETIVQAADRLNITLCLENMFGRSALLVEPDEFCGPLEQFPSLKITLDVGHANIRAAGSSRIVRFIELFADRLGHLHISDNFGREDNHLPVGAGTVDFPKVVKALKHAGYGATATFEIFSRDRSYLVISREKFEHYWRQFDPA
jgi:sugar phosphate isomerase/epimerase